jgi:LSD1 subclass zinc finger protein
MHRDKKIAEALSESLAREFAPRQLRLELAKHDNPLKFAVRDPPLLARGGKLLRCALCNAARSNLPSVLRQSPLQMSGRSKMFNVSCHDCSLTSRFHTPLAR